MAGITELLVALNTKEAAVSTADLARELGEELHYTWGQDLRFPAVRLGVVEKLLPSSYD